jgi:hypothetical protein
LLCQLCNPSYHILLEADTLSVLDNGNSILSGRRENSTGMWHIPLPSASPKHLSQHSIKQSAADMIAFVHATLFSPALSTLATALAISFLTNFPGLTSMSLRKFPPASVPMPKGHLDQARMNQQSKCKGTIIAPGSDDPIHGEDNFTPPSSYHQNVQMFLRHCRTDGTNLY